MYKRQLPREAESYAQEGRNAVETLIDDVDKLMDETIADSAETETPKLEVVRNPPVTDADSDEAQQVLDSLLAQIPEEASSDEFRAKGAGGISNDALTGDDLDALIEGDWS